MKGCLRKIDSPFYERRLFLLCWMAYCVSYLGRLNYSAAMTAMIQERVLDSGQAGIISMLYFLAYGIGQLINGFLGDRTQPKRMILVGLGGSAIINACMGRVQNFFTMACIWAVNGYVQSMIWTPCIRIFAEMLTEHDKMRCSVNISSSGVVGTLLSYVISAAVLAVFPWKAVFIIPAVLLFLTALVFKIGFQSVLDFSNSEENELLCGPENMIEDRQDKREEEQASFKQLFWHSGVLLIVVPVVVHGVLKDGVTAWVPTYISATFGLAPSFAVLLTTVLPVINLVGAYVGWGVYRSMKNNISRSNMVFFASSAISLLALLAFGRMSPVLSVILLATITSSMMAVNMLSISIYPLKFEKIGRVSSVSGFLNAMAYMGSAVSTLIIGVIVEHRGWQVTIATWLAATLLAVIICFLTIKKVKGEKV